MVLPLIIGGAVAYKIVHNRKEHKKVALRQREELEGNAASTFVIPSGPDRGTDSNRAAVDRSEKGFVGSREKPGVVRSDNRRAAHPMQQRDEPPSYDVTLQGDLRIEDALSRPRSPQRVSRDGRHGRESVVNTLEHHEQPEQIGRKNHSSRRSVTHESEVRNGKSDVSDSEEN